MRIHVIFLCLVLIQRIDGEIKYIIWDAGSTLVQVSRLSIARELGMKYILDMFVNFVQPQTMHELMFDVLEQYKGKQKPAPHNGLYTCDNYNRPLPHFMSDTWLCSRITNKEILRKVDKAIVRWKPKQKITDKQRQLIKKTLSTALCAHVLGKYTVCPSRALEIVQDLKRRGYQQYILSNFEKEAFRVAYNNKKNKQLFECIALDNIVISGDCGMIKPHPAIYYYFLDKYGLAPEECLLIDDRIENVIAAQKLRINAILIENGNYKELNKKIKKLLRAPS